MFALMRAMRPAAFAGWVPLALAAPPLGLAAALLC
jgi:hypothetical protein